MCCAYEVSRGSRDVMLMQMPGSGDHLLGDSGKVQQL